MIGANARMGDPTDYLRRMMASGMMPTPQGDQGFAPSDTAWDEQIPRPPSLRDAMGAPVDRFGQMFGTQPQGGTLGDMFGTGSLAPSLPTTPSQEGAAGAMSHASLPNGGGSMAPGVLNAARGPKRGLLGGGAGAPDAAPVLGGADIAPQSDGPLTTMPNIGAEMATATGNMRIKKPKFFDKDGAWRPTLEAISEMAMELGGNPAQMAFLQNKWAMKRDAANDARTQAQRAADQSRADMAAAQERAWKASQPDYFTVGNDRVRYDPTSNKSDVVYSEKQPFEDYATAMGYDPGTPEYQTALKDYVLRGNGPTAYGFDEQLDNVRAGNRARLKAMPTYGQSNPRPRMMGGRAGGGGGGSPRTLAGVMAPVLGKMARGVPLTPSEQAAWNAYRPAGGGRARGGAAAGGGGGNIVINPSTGEKKRWDGKAWVTVR